MRNFLASLVVVTVLVTISVVYVDKSLSLAVKSFVGRSRYAAGYARDIPDLLQLFVIFITVGSFFGYVLRALNGIDDATTRFFRLVTFSVPAAYFVRSATKFMFGRINTREWLQKPELYGFHWFQGTGNFHGFPSGHIMIFSTLCAAMWRHYPRCRIPCSIFLLLQAAALIVTNYHFLGDIIAGIYLGIIVEVGIHKALTLCRRDKNSEATITS